MDMAAIPRLGISASPTEASTAAATETTAPGVAGALKTAGLCPSRELLAACRAALGKGARLGAIAGIKGRALCREATRPGRPTKLRGAEVGACLGTGHMSARTPCKPLSPGVGRGQTGLPRGATSSRTDQPSGACRCGRGEPFGAARPGPGGPPSRIAAIVPTSGGSGRRAAKALTGCRVAIGDTLAVHRVVLPGVPGDHGAIGVNSVELARVDRDAAAAPIGTPPPPQRTGDGDPGAKGEAGR
jgi:hypothetical protein